MEFLADFHVHSKYSIATAGDADLNGYYKWAQIKGVSLVGTGDFTHPEYFREISKSLEESDGGLLAIREDLCVIKDNNAPERCRTEVRFVPTAEISCIYKRGGRTRKVHNIIVAPSLKSATKISEKLEKIGNIASDGRPILGLDSEDLLKIVLDAGDGAFLIPAHIWTPHFSILGEKSGFDTIEECFGTVSDNIFAAETGLSSDPKMNWRVSALDRITLVSNSDAHSPSKLAREANIFNCALSYKSVKHALMSGDGFDGTIEMFPEEGKYHLAGHRKCSVRLNPAESKKLNHICPVCGTPVTPGVLARVDELADRPEGQKPKKAKKYESLVPLAEIIAISIGKGPKTKSVSNIYWKLLRDLGNELHILRIADRDAIARSAGEKIADAVLKVRAGKVEVIGGFDGRYGTVKIL